MLHEILLALVGCDGDIIKQDESACTLNPGFAELFLYLTVLDAIFSGSPPSRTPLMRRNCPLSSRPLLDGDGPLDPRHPGEIELIQRICRLGHHYGALDRFVQAVQNEPLGELAEHVSHEHTPEPVLEPAPESEPEAAVVSPPVSPIQGGGGVQLRHAYVAAVAAAIEEMLQAYVVAVADAEVLFLEDPDLPLSQLAFELRKHAAVLPALHDLVAHIEREDLCGSPLLDELERRCSCGVPAIAMAFGQLHAAALSVFFHQLGSWAGHGLLEPRFAHEFFIADGNAAAAGGSSAHTLEDGASGMGTGSQGSGEWHGRFEVVVDRVPRLLTPTQAQKLLFIGKAARVLQQHDRLRFETQRAWAGSLNQLLRDEAASGRGPVVGPPSPIRLAVQIEATRAEAAALLWQLAVVDAGLADALLGFRQIFLMARGDLWQQFIDDCRGLTALRPAANTTRELNLCFRRAVGASLLAAGSSLEAPLEARTAEHFAVVLDTTAAARPADGPQEVPLGARAERSVFDLWRGLSLSYRPQWPANLLLTTDMLERYSDLFSLLFTVKRVQMGLHACWGPLVARQRGTEMRRVAASLTGQRRGAELGEGVGPGFEEEAGLMAVLTLRRHMSFVVDNLHYYLQVDVVDAAFGRMRAELEAASDFEQAVAAHAAYLSTISAQCFVHQRIIAQALDMLLESALAFCTNINSTLFDQVAAEFSLTEISRVSKAFLSQVLFLFKILHGAKVQQSSPHLARLLLRLDFSQFYSDALGLQQQY